MACWCNVTDQYHRLCIHNEAVIDRWLCPQSWTLYANTHTHPLNGPLSRTNWVSRYHKGKTNLDFTEARDSEWKWHQLGHMQVCTLLQTDNHASTQTLSFFTGRMPFLPPNQQRQSNKQPWCHKLNIQHGHCSLVGPDCNNSQASAACNGYSYPHQHPTAQFFFALPVAQSTVSKHWRQCAI